MIRKASVELRRRASIETKVYITMLPVTSVLVRRYAQTPAHPAGPPKGIEQRFAQA